MRRVTAADVARATGVSRSAVSRAFTAGAPVAAETRRLVLGAAERLGYAPNRLARGLLTGRSNLVAVVVNTVSDLWDTAYFDELFRALQAAGRHPLIVHTGGAADLAQVLRDGAAYQVDGALVFADDITPAAARSAFGAAALVMLNGLDRAGDRVDAVRIDERSDLARLVEALVAAGHRRIAYVAGRRTASFEGERRAAVRDALRAAGLAPFGPAAGGAYSHEAGLMAGHALLGGRDRPDAAVCACDAIALGVIDAARGRGVAVPGDLSVVGFDDVPLAAWPPYDLTTVHQDVPGLVRAAVDLLARRIASPRRRPETRIVPTSIVLRGSARLPPAMSIGPLGPTPIPRAGLHDRPGRPKP